MAQTPTAQASRRAVALSLQRQLRQLFRQRLRVFQRRQRLGLRGPGVGFGAVARPRRQLLQVRGQRGARLGAVGRALQGALGGVPQDVEGGVVADGRLFVVQSRPQPI